MIDCRRVTTAWKLVCNNDPVLARFQKPTATIDTPFVKLDPFKDTLKKLQKAFNEEFLEFRKKWLLHHDCADMTPPRGVTSSRRSSSPPPGNPDE